MPFEKESTGNAFPTETRDRKPVVQIQQRVSVEQGCAREVNVVETGDEKNLLNEPMEGAVQIGVHHSCWCSRNRIGDSAAKI